MVIRNISPAKAQLSALLEEVQKGNEVILAKAGKPLQVGSLFRSGQTSGARSNGGRDLDCAYFDPFPKDMAEAFGMTEPLG